MKTFLKISKFFFSQKNIEETVPSPSQGTDSGNEETNNEYDRNEENYENEKVAIRRFLMFTGILSLAKLKN